MWPSASTASPPPPLCSAAGPPCSFSSESVKAACAFGPPPILTQGPQASDGGAPCTTQRSPAGWGPPQAVCSWSPVGSPVAGSDPNGRAAADGPGTGFLRRALSWGACRAAARRLHAHLPESSQLIQGLHGFCLPPSGWSLRPGTVSRPRPGAGSGSGEGRQDARPRDGVPEGLGCPDPVPGGGHVISVAAR